MELHRMSFYTQSKILLCLSFLAGASTEAIKSVANESPFTLRRICVTLLLGFISFIGGKIGAILWRWAKQRGVMPSILDTEEGDDKPEKSKEK